MWLELGHATLILYISLPLFYKKRLYCKATLLSRKFLSRNSGTFIQLLPRAWIPVGRFLHVTFLLWLLVLLTKPDQSSLLTPHWIVTACNVVANDASSERSIRLTVHVVWKLAVACPLTLIFALRHIFSFFAFYRKKFCPILSSDHSSIAAHTVFRERGQRAGIVNHSSYRSL